MKYRTLLTMIILTVLTGCASTLPKEQASVDTYTTTVSEGEVKPKGAMGLMTIHIDKNATQRPKGLM